MTRNIIFSLFTVLLLLSCNSKNNVEIKGDIKEANKQNVYLEQMNVDNITIIDSTKTDKKGRFKFKTAVTIPTFYNIRIGKNETVTIIAEPDDKIELSGTLKNLRNNYWVDGSENSLWIKLLNFQLNNTHVAMDSLKKTYAEIPQGEDSNPERIRIAAKWDSIMNKQINFSRDFILKHAISPASYYALYQKLDKDNYILSPEEDLHSYKIVASSLKAMYPESQYTQAILKHLEQINKGLKNLKMMQLIANTENSLPQISLPDIKGDTLSLLSLKGKYILLDFTVLNAANAQAYINDMKNVYHKFHAKGLEIYQVCLDPNKLLWEKLVKQYGINWTCVWDADALQSKAAKVWNIQNVPANYIINKKYEIVGKNLTGRRLEERLNDIIK